VLDSVAKHSIEYKTNIFAESRGVRFVLEYLWLYVENAVKQKKQQSSTRIGLEYRASAKIVQRLTQKM